MAAQFAGSTLIDHLSDGLIRFAKKQKVYIRTKSMKEIDAAKMKWAFLFNGSSGILDAVAELECIRNGVTSAGYSFRRCLWRAMATASARFAAPSFPKIVERFWPTLSTRIPSAFAMS